MFAHVCLARAEAINDLANVQLTFVQQEPEDGEPGGITEHSEALGDVLKQMFGEGVCHGCYYITLELFSQPESPYARA